MCQSTCHPLYHGLHNVADTVKKATCTVPHKILSVEFSQAKLHSVPLTDGSVTTVPIFDVKALLIAFLNDPLRMRQENYASYYDIFTGKMKLPTSTLDEMHTGSLWEQARQNSVVMIQMHCP